ncbi:reverse transcriptase, partial [Tanacetum coccineum]
MQQEGHPIAYLSKALSSKHQSLSTYEKEFLAVLLAVDKWRGYLMDKHFKIKTNHFSLKYLLDQRLTTPFQAKWLPKLLGFDFEISYKKGSENIVADALSRVEGSTELNSLILSTITSDLLQKVKDNYVQDSGIQYVYLHGLPSSIVSDRDAIFLSNFWKSLFKLLKVELKMSTAYHPQTDGQTKVVNKCLECFLRCMSGERPKEWVQWLPLAEFCAVEVVDRTLQAREAAIEMLKFHLKRSQDKMKVYADRKRSEREFE